jgi:hypothetical protein
MPSSDSLDSDLSLDERTEILVKKINESIDSKRQAKSRGRSNGPAKMSLAEASTAPTSSSHNQWDSKIETVYSARQNNQIPSPPPKSSKVTFLCPPEIPARTSKKIASLNDKVVVKPHPTARRSNKAISAAERKPSKDDSVKPQMHSHEAKQKNRKQTSSNLTKGSSSDFRREKFNGVLYTPPPFVKPRLVQGPAPSVSELPKSIVPTTSAPSTEPPLKRDDDHISYTTPCVPELLELKVPPIDKPVRPIVPPTWAINGDFSKHEFVPRWLRNMWSGELDNIWDGHFGYDSGVGYLEPSLQHSEQFVGRQVAGLPYCSPEVYPSEADWTELKELLDSIHLCQNEY